ncbi:MAG: RNA polymerase sigma factor RpoD/SigA [Acidobacteriota bacterium]|nr:RNA polymerase sigma factor RpoD/SigA [Acidobacteriota bacterium]
MGSFDALDSRNLRRYLEEISKFPLFGEKEEKEMGQRIHQGDAEALRRLIESNLRFVVSYVKRYQGMGLGLLDLIHEGNLGLIEAARRFDPKRNVKFISYAVWWIRQAVIHALTQSQRIAHVPQKLSDQILQMKRKAIQLKSELDRDPTREEIAERMGLTVQDIEDLEMLVEKDVSLSDSFNDDDMKMEEKLSDGVTPSVEHQVVKSSILSQLRDVMNELDEKEALVLKWRFGLDDDQPLTLQEIGDRLHLTRERIRQIEQKAIGRLRRSSRLEQLRGYLN